MGGVFHFQNYPVYIEARKFRSNIRRIIKEKYPKEEQYCLISQLWRALDSVLLNIAEGSERYSKVDFSRFLNNSLSSLNEVVACLDISLDESYLSKDDYEDLLRTAENIYRQLKAFSAKIRSTKPIS